MGRRTSVYLSTALEAAIAKDGRSLSEILWSGIYAAQTGTPNAETPARTHTADGPPECPHPPGRVFKGLCYQCGKPVS
jgi:hypothetical protein